MADPQPQPQPQPPSGPRFSIQKIYVKDLSLEIRARRSRFSSRKRRRSRSACARRGEQIEQDVFECVLTITVTAKVGDKIVFLVEAAQGGRVPDQGRSAGRHPAHHRHPLSERAFPLRSRDHRRRNHPGGVPAGPSGSDQFRASVPAAARESRTTAGCVAGSQLE